MKTFVRTDQYSCRFFPFLFLPFERIILISFWVIFTANLSHPQNFLLTTTNSTHYSIDKIAKHVYFKDFYSDTVRRVDLKTLEVIKTDFLYIPPVLSNRLHLMLNANKLYDIDKKTFCIIDNSHTDSLGLLVDASFAGAFSPNDSNFIYGNPKYYLSLKDSIIRPTGLSVFGTVNYNIIDAYPQWSSDTSFVFLSGDNVIAEYFLNSKKLDTLVNFVDRANILGFAYNSKYNILAFSTNESPPKIYFHYKNSNSDSLVFSPLRDDVSSPCWVQPIGLTSLTWSPDNKKLAFGIYHYTYPITGIYVYSIDSNKTYKGTSCDDYGLKTTFHWANNDTLIYVSETDWYLYGMDLSSLISVVDDKKDEDIPTNFTISNYPNPFNGSTIITINLPNNTTGVLYIYDTLGKIVKKYQLDKKGEKKYEINWNGLNEQNQNLSSGFYLGVLKSDDSKTQSTKTIKMIYLK